MSYDNTMPYNAARVVGIPNQQEALNNITKKVVDILCNARIGFGINGADMSIDVPLVESLEENGVQIPSKYPVICIINGAGGNGKNTFIEETKKYCSAEALTSIEEVKNAVDGLIKSQIAYDSIFTADPARSDMENKSEAYRTFLHEVKAAWVKYSDGPNVVLLSQMYNLIQTHKCGEEHYDVIYLQIREPEEITKVVEFIKGTLGLVCITVLVSGRVSPEEYVNYADSGVFNYMYDLIVDNSGSKNSLELRAQLFAKSLKAANCEHGIPTAYLNDAPDLYDDHTCSNVGVSINETTDMQADAECEPAPGEAIAEDPSCEE